MKAASIGGALALLSFAGTASADRIVLAPTAIIVPPASVKAEAALRIRGGRNSLGWLGVGLPWQDAGFEAELERQETDGEAREGLSLQYTFTGNAAADIAASLCAGGRDVLNSGLERRAFFLAASRTVGLTRNLERAVIQLRVHGGYGTSALGGLYGGVEAVLQGGIRLALEYLPQRLNASVSAPLLKNLAIRAYSLDGEAYYGASLSLSR